MSRPFFSLVIPCYNDGRYVPGQYIDRLLTSVLEQDLEKDDIEVIIADDHSPMPYDATLDRYRDRINIKFVLTDYNFGPGNSRQKGSEVAEGEWLCFADHDDLFYPKALTIVKNVIQQTGEKYFAESSFKKVDHSDLDKVLESFEGNRSSTWVHGKFYNLDNFWKPGKLHFIKDLRTHEDLALGKLVECALHKIDRTPTIINHPTYKWVFNPDSVSHGTYGSQKIGGVLYSFFETHFDDFLESQVGALLEAYDDGNITKEEAVSLVVTAISSTYMSVCTFRTEHPKKYLRSPEAYEAKMWARVKEKLDITTGVVKVMLQTSMKGVLDKVNTIAADCNQTDLLSWYDRIDNLDFDAIIDAEQAKTIRTKKAPAKKKAENPDHRPFFSIIIACYNDGRYQEGVYLDRLLSSLTRQNMPKEDLEVVLSDDCSPTPFEHVWAKYEDQLTIKYTKTDYNFAPGNTRAKGVEIATGEWMAFADHDDIYYDGALKKIHDGIIEKDEQHFIFGDFYGVSPEGEIVRKYECHLNWCHGKFYNRDNLWDKYGIHFIHDLKSHEDIAICTQVSCLFMDEIKSYSYMHFPVYAWTDNPQSVSHAKYTIDTEDGPREFLEVFYEDYITATGWIYVNQFKEHNIKMVNAIKGVLEIMCYCYFYLQGFQFRRPNDFYKKNLEIAGNFVTECKKTFNMTNESMYNAIASNGAHMYYQIRGLADPGSGRYIPTQTLKEWFELVSPDGKEVESSDKA